MSIVEFVRWSATDDYLKDFHSRVKPTLSYVQNADGCTSVYYGLEEEDPTVVWMIFFWKTIEHHKVMMKRLDYPDMVAGLKPFLRDGQMKMYHVEFNNDTAVAFTAPTTAISTLTISESQEREHLIDWIDLIEMLDEKIDQRQGIAWGEIQEEPGKYMVVAGNQIHEDVGVEELSSKAVTIQVVHAKISKYVQV